jgi:hypothetical protein
MCAERGHVGVVQDAGFGQHVPSSERPVALGLMLDRPHHSGGKSEKR